jgi:hypothetical protein
MPATVDPAAIGCAALGNALNPRLASACSAGCQLADTFGRVRMLQAQHNAAIQVPNGRTPAVRGSDLQRFETIDRGIGFVGGVPGRWGNGSGKGCGFGFGTGGSGCARQTWDVCMTGPVKSSSFLQGRESRMACFAFEMLDTDF